MATFAPTCYFFVVPTSAAQVRPEIKERVIALVDELKRRTSPGVWGDICNEAADMLTLGGLPKLEAWLIEKLTVMDADDQRKMYNELRF